MIIDQWSDDVFFMYFLYLFTVNLTILVALGIISISRSEGMNVQHMT